MPTSWTADSSGSKRYAPALPQCLMESIWSRNGCVTSNENFPPTSWISLWLSESDYSFPTRDCCCPLGQVQCRLRSSSINEDSVGAWKCSAVASLTAWNLIRAKEQMDYIRGSDKYVHDVAVTCFIGRSSAIKVSDKYSYSIEIIDGSQVPWVVIANL